MATTTTFNVTKRKGGLEVVSFDKITKRLEKLSRGLHVAPLRIAQKTIASVFDGIQTRDIDTLTADIAISLATDHPDYGVLASNILIANLHKETNSTLLSVFKLMYTNTNQYGEKASLLAEDVWEVVKKHHKHLDSLLNFQKDYSYDYFAVKTMEKIYLTKVNGKIVERPQHMLMRVALGIWKDNIPRVEETYKLLSDKFFTHASPTIFNAGMRHPQLSSCFLLDMGDSIDSIYKTLSDCAKISKHGGGIGVNAHDIRSRDAIIRGTNGFSTGIIPMLRAFNATARYVNQGSRRNGSFAIYLEPHHPDIFEFLEAKKNHGDEEDRARDLFYGLWVSDLFMKRVEADGVWSLMDPDRCKGLSLVYGDEFEALYTKYETEGRYTRQVKAQEVWSAILTSQIEQGVPYVCYKDAVNKKSNQKNIGTIKSSNLCVAPDTQILTSKGYFPIKVLAGEKVEVWNGKEFSETEVVKTGENQDMVKVTFSNGFDLECTEYHRFYIQDGYWNKNPVLVEAKDLKEGMKLIKSDFPVIESGIETFKYPYTHGFYTGDGTNHIQKNGTRIPGATLYGEKIKLLEHLEIRSTSGKITAQGTLNCLFPRDLAPKFTVPVDQSVRVKLEWLSGYADADGTIARNGTNESLQICSIDIDFLKTVGLMVQTLGVDMKITPMHISADRMMPDGIGGMKEYHCQTSYRLLIGSTSLQKLVALGFAPKRLSITKRSTNRNASQFVQVVSVETLERKSDTYCFNEPKRHAGIFNGVISSQCSEITLFTSPDEVACCNLSSISLPKYITAGKFDFHELYKVTRVVTRNLNQVIDVTFYPIPEAARSNFKHRPLGIGVQGLADAFIMLRLPFDSPEAAELNKHIFETIYFAALEESVELAKEQGTYESYKGSPISKGILQFDMWDVKPSLDLWDWARLKKDIKKYGVRNSMLTAIMPTASTSQLLGNNEAIEPYTANMYLRKTLAGEFLVINKHLIKDLIGLELWNEDMKNAILQNNGSVQNIPGIPEDIKQLYKTVWEIKQRVLIDMAAGRGPYICQSQSLNLWVANPNFKILTSMLFHGWRLGLKTGQYYHRSRSAAGAIKVAVSTGKKETVQEEPQECLMCSG
jgi:ribonucleoside-diphosphate reductase alpha chain